MAGLFQTIELGKRALLTHQIYLQTIGHNIANVDTPGYSRQRVRITSTRPEFNTIGAIGSGVEATDIRHVRDLFLGEQYRRETKALGQWSYKDKILYQVEALFGEPNDNTLSDLINDFWDAWSDLSTNPSSTSHRVAVLEYTNLLTSRFHQMANQLSTLQEATDSDMVAMVNDVNRLSAEIALLNNQVKMQELGGNRANDLRDIRDRLVDELALLVDVNTLEQDNGELTVYIGAMGIVDGPDTTTITSETFTGDGTIGHRLLLGNSTITITNNNGQIKGLMDTRDILIPRYQNELNNIVQELVQRVNSLHSAGYGLDGSTGNNFFDANYTDAANIRLNPIVENDTARIAASGTGEVGDNSVALAIQTLRNQKIMENNTSTLNNYYNSVVGRLGVEAYQARSFSENSELLVHQVYNARQSVQGVSLDEEMTNLVKSQHAYDAAARIITVMDEALDTVILRMGIVGR
ncbi:MAG: flagellar hook-associated protein FlgK [bacterium]